MILRHRHRHLRNVVDHRLHWLHLDFLVHWFLIHQCHHGHRHHQNHQIAPLLFLDQFSEPDPPPPIAVIEPNTELLPLFPLAIQHRQLFQHHHHRQ
jgi:hypothetical protein